MTVVDAETGEVIAHCSPEEARDITDRIRDGLTLTWQLVVEAHDRKAWAAMGYGSFRAWVEGELNISRGHAYRMLDHGRVMQALAEHAGVSPMGDIPERLTRGLTPEDVVELADDMELDLPVDPSDADKVAGAARMMSDLSRKLSDRQRQEREEQARSSGASPSATTDAPRAGEEVEGGSLADAPTPEPDAGTIGTEAVDQATQNAEDTDVRYRERLSSARKAAFTLTKLDPERCAAVSLVEDRVSDDHFIEAMRGWLDKFDNARRRSQIRSVG